MTGKILQPLHPKDKVYKDVTFVDKGYNEVIGLLTGTSGFGRVYSATQRSDGKLVAIKKMDHTSQKEILSNLSEIGFLRTCVHPNIVQFVKAFTVNKEVWVSELPTHG